MRISCGRCGRDAETVGEGRLSLPRGWTGSLFAEIPMRSILCPLCTFDNMHPDVASDLEFAGVGSADGEGDDAE